MTNRHSERLQLKQLQAEHRQSHQERTATLRREVYLPASDAFIGMVSALAKLLNLETSDDEAAEKARDFGAALTRIQMVALPATISRAADLQRAFIETIAAVTRSRIPMKDRQARIDAVALEMDAFDGQKQRLRHELAQAARDHRPSADLNAFADLSHQVRIVCEAQADAHADRLRLMIAQQEARAEQFRDFANRIEHLVCLQAPLLAEIRAELEGDEALQLITEELRETNAVGVRAMTDMIPAFERSAQEMRNELASLEQRLAVASGP
jgi:hypothetical protein